MIRKIIHITCIFILTVMYQIQAQTKFVFYKPSQHVGAGVNLVNPKVKIIINPTTNLELPTVQNTNFVVVFYKIDSYGSLVTVGKNAYKPGERNIIKLNNDNTGNLGYLSGERFITALKDTVNNMIYPVEFNYKDNKNSYGSITDSFEILSVKKKVWDIYQEDSITLCQNNPFQFAYQPIYGFAYNVNIPQSSSVDTIASTFNSSSLPIGTYKFIIKYGFSSNFKDSLWINIVNQPSIVLNETIKICDGDEYKVKSKGVDYQYVDINSVGFNLTNQGSYIYELNYKGNCPMNDTIQIAFKECTNNQNIINPNKNVKLFFSEHDVLRIFNKYDEQVATFETPLEWDGTDNQGKLLPPGVYFGIFEKEKKNISMTILH